MRDDDAALLRRYRNGEAAAFTQLYERHRLGLFRFLLGLCGDHALAEEVFQDTWMSLIRSASEQREAVLTPDPDLEILHVPDPRGPSDNCCQLQRPIGVRNPNAVGASVVE